MKRLTALRTLLVMLTFTTLGVLPCVAQQRYLEHLPCGPAALRGPIRFLIPQGLRGADFRPACRIHDNCYATQGANRANCDAKFLNGMLNACQNSRSPWLCRVTAKAMYRATRRFGGLAFNRGKQTAGK